MEWILKHRKAIITGLAVFLIVCYLTPNDFIQCFLRLDSQVWGSVSDWVMITVTLFTAIYLVRTFNEQKRTNDLTALQYRRSIMPNFRVGKKFDVDEMHSDVHFVDVVLENNPAYKVSFKSLHKNLSTNVEGKEFNFTPGQGRMFPYKIDQTRVIEFSDTAILEIVFSDIESNTYKQIVYKFNGWLNITYPEKLS